MRVRLLMCFLVTLTASAAAAVDHPIATGIIRLEDPPGRPFLRRFSFRASKQAQIVGATLPDPTVAGATLEVFGTGAGDGSSGVLNLPADGWEKIRNGGYYYRDHSAANGVSQVRIVLRGSAGGALHIGGRTENWLYQVTQPQTSVKMKLTIAGHIYCAEATTLQPNYQGIVFGKKIAAPVNCN